MTVPAELESNPIIRKLLAFDANAVLDAVLFRNQLTLFLPTAKIRDICEFLKSDPELQFNYLSDLTAVDRFPHEPRFEIVYQLYSIPSKTRLRLKVTAGGDEPAVDSLSSLWPLANWFERELYDLFGIRFHGHPDLKRILLPDDWVGHPLRKDYPVEGPR